MTEAEKLFELLKDGISPAHAVSACEKRLTEAGFELLPTWQDALGRYLKEIEF